jgi:hypothetical protein
MSTQGFRSEPASMVPELAEAHASAAALSLPHPTSNSRRVSERSPASSKGLRSNEHDTMGVVDNPA